MEKRPEELTEEPVTSMPFAELDKFPVLVDSGSIQITEELPQSNLAQDPEYIIEQTRRVLRNYKNIVSFNHSVGNGVEINRVLTFGELFRAVLAEDPGLIIRILKSINNPVVLTRLSNFDESKIVEAKKEE